MKIPRMVVTDTLLSLFLEWYLHNLSFQTAKLECLSSSLFDNVNHECVTDCETNCLTTILYWNRMFFSCTNFRPLFTCNPRKCFDFEVNYIWFRLTIMHGKLGMLVVSIEKRNFTSVGTISPSAVLILAYFMWVWQTFLHTTWARNCFVSNYRRVVFFCRFFVQNSTSVIVDSGFGLSSRFMELVTPKNRKNRWMGTFTSLQFILVRSWSWIARITVYNHVQIDTSTVQFIHPLQFDFGP